MSTTVRRQKGGDVKERVKSFRKLKIFDWEGILKFMEALDCTGEEIGLGG